MNRHEAGKVTFGDRLDLDQRYNESERPANQINSPAKVYGIVYDESQTGVLFVVKNKSHKYVVLDAGWFTGRSGMK